MRDDELKRIETIAARWAAERGGYDHQLKLNARFANATALDLMSMWANVTNEAGRRLTKFEAEALVGAWVRVFGAPPPTRRAHGGPQALSEPVLRRKAS